MSPGDLHQQQAPDDRALITEGGLFKGDDSRITVLLAYYQSARSEMLLRIREREIAMYVWLTALGTVLAVSFRSPPPDYRVLLILPVLALGISFRIAQHESLISELAKYCKTEIGPVIREGARLTDVRHWDESETLAHYQKVIVSTRAIVNAVLLVLPSVAAITLNWDVLTRDEGLLSLALYSGIVFTAGSAWFLLRAVIERLANAVRRMHDGVDHPG